MESQFITILSIPDCGLLLISNSNTSILTSGTFRLLHFEDQNIYIIAVEDYRYTLSKELTVVGDSHGRYVLPDVDGYMMLVLNEPVWLEYKDVLNDVMACHCAFHFVQEFMNAITQRSDEPDGEAGIQEEVKEVVPGTRTQRMANFIRNGGDKLKNKLISGAAWAGERINKSGDYAKGKIKQKETPTQVSEETKGKIAKAKAASMMALAVSRTVASNAANATSQFASTMSSKIQGSNTGQKMSGNRHYQNAMEIGRAGINAAINVYEGIEESVIKIAQSIGGTTSQLIRHRYGEQAGDAALQSMLTAANFALMSREIKKLGFKKLAKSTAAKTAVRFVEGEERKE